MKRYRQIALCAFICATCLLCSCSNTQQATSSTSSSSTHEEMTNSESETASASEAEESDSLVERAEDEYEKVESAITEEIDDRKNATPTHAAIGEEVNVTDNLAVKVVSVEAGPYDYANRTNTMKVVVQMRNLTDKKLMVKRGC